MEFRDSGTQDIFNRIDTKLARRTCPRLLWPGARRKLDQLATVTRLEDLRVPPGNALEALRGDRSGQQSIRINQQYRVCFRWTETGPRDVEIVDDH